MKIVRAFNDKALTPETRATAAALPVVERQSLIEATLYRYPRFKDATSFVSKFHRPVLGGTPGRGVLGQVVGQSRAGKSFVLQTYANDFPGAPDDGFVRRPVVYVEIRGAMSLLELVILLYRSIGYKSVPNIKRDAMIGTVLDALRYHRVELIIFDDIHNALARNVGVTQQILNFLKDVLDTHTCNVLCSGREESTLR